MGEALLALFYTIGQNLRCGADITTTRECKARSGLCRRLKSVIIREWHSFQIPNAPIPLFPSREDVSALIAYPQAIPGVGQMDLILPSLKRIIPFRHIPFQDAPPPRVVNV